MSTAVLFQIQSGLILSVMIYGILNHKIRPRHVKVMSTVIIWDILLILQIELSRGAIAKASKAVDNAIMLNIHVGFAITTVILYGFMIYTGRKTLKGQVDFLKKHRFLGYTTTTLRILTFITSFFAVPVQG